MSVYISEPNMCLTWHGMVLHAKQIRTLSINSFSHFPFATAAACIGSAPIANQV